MESEKQSRHNSFNTYKRLIRYASQYRWRLIAGMLCGILFSGSTVSILPQLKNVLGKFVNTEGNIDTHAVLIIGLGIIVLVVLRGIGQFFSAYLIQWVGNRVVMDMRIGTFKHLQNLSVGFFNSTQTGEMISRTVNDSMLLERAVSTVLTDLAQQPVALLGVMGYALYLDWKLTVLNLFIFPLCIMPILGFGRRVRKASRQGQERLAEIVSIMQESIRGVRIVKAFCKEDRELERFSRESYNFFRRIMKVVRSKAMIEPIIGVVAGIAMIVDLAYAAHVKMPLNEFMTLGLSMFMLYKPVKQLSKIHLNIQQSSAAADRIFEILDTEAAVTDAPDAIEFTDELQEITFDKVSFSYGERDVLCDVDLRVKAGERIALVGGSGAGKTTLVNLLPRFFDVTSGSIALNGIDIRRMTLESLRLRMGLVTQDTFLFNDTVRNNIAYGNDNATQEEVEDAARKAHAHDFIMEMPHGYETTIGELGARLSGGQRQRLAIARAILNNPAILILDEATSALDTESERLVQQALDELVAGRTVFAIAHRLSTIKNCDRIIVMDQGRIVESGTHDDLLAAGGVYKRLYDMQFDK